MFNEHDPEKQPVESSDALFERQQFGLGFLPSQPVPLVLSIALDTAQAGTAVFFLSVAKTPLKGSHGFKEATKDENELIALYDRYRGATYVAYATGPINGVAVLDLDFKHSEAVAWYEANKHRLPATFTYRTRSGGLHLVYQDHPDLKTAAGNIAPGVRLANGGSACAWLLTAYEIWIA